jgi:hypothetical protein
MKNQLANRFRRAIRRIRKATFAECYVWMAGLDAVLNVSAFIKGLNTIQLVEGIAWAIVAVLTYYCWVKR